MNYTVFGENAGHMTRGELWGVRVIFFLTLIVSTTLYTFLASLLVDKVLSFIDFSYWEWFRVVALITVYNLSTAIRMVRMDSGLKSLVSRLN